MLSINVLFLLFAVAFGLMTSLAKADLPPSEQPIGQPAGPLYDHLAPTPPSGMSLPFGTGQNSPPVVMSPTSQPISYPTPAFEMPPTGYQMPPTGFSTPQLGIPQTAQPFAYVGFQSPVFSPISIDDASPTVVSPSRSPTGKPSFLPTMQPTQSPAKKVVRKMCRRRKLKIRINGRPLVQGNMKMMRKTMVRKRA